MAIKAWGRIITFLIQDNNPEEKFDISIFKQNTNEELKNLTNSPKKKPTRTADITEYLQNNKHGRQWYTETDKRLQPFAIELMKLTCHSRREVKLELSFMCQIVIENCLT